MSGEEKKEGDKLKIDLIKDGTVIDHIQGGWGIEVIDMLGIKSPTDNVLSVAINVQSKSMGHKDIVKIEGRELKPAEVDKIAIIAPRATINVIRNTEVISKKRVELPAVMEGIIICQNPTCITRAVRDDDPSIPKEPVKTRFVTLNPESEESTFECDYCHSILSRKQAIEALI
jgi:aspartate carbamoyltransferase regulatory subunit